MLPEPDELPAGTTDGDEGGTTADEVDPTADADAGSADGTDAGDADGEDDAWKKDPRTQQLLRQKTEAEAIRKRNQELEAQLANGGNRQPTTDTPRSDERLAREAEMLEADVNHFTMLSQSKDEEIARYGRAQLRAIRADLRESREAAFQRELRQVPVKLRDRVEELVRSGDVRRVNRAREIAEKEAELEELRNGKGRRDDDHEDERREAKRLRRDSEPETTVRAVTRSEARSRTWSESKYRARLADLRQSGDMDGMRQLIADRESRKILIQD